MCHHCEYEDMARTAVDAAGKHAKDAIAKKDSAARATFRVNTETAKACIPVLPGCEAEYSDAEERGAKAIADDVLAHRAELPFTDDASFVSGLVFGHRMGLNQAVALMQVAEHRAIRKALGVEDDEERIHGRRPDANHEGRPRA